MFILATGMNPVSLSQKLSNPSLVIKYFILAPHYICQQSTPPPPPLQKVSAQLSRHISANTCTYISPFSQAKISAVFFNVARLFLISLPLFLFFPLPGVLPFPHPFIPLLTCSLISYSKPPLHSKHSTMKCGWRRLFSGFKELTE